MKASTNSGAIKNKLKRVFKWFYPGMHVKRWVLLIILGLLILIGGVLLFFLDWTVLLRIKSALQYLFAQLPFSPLADPWREIIALGFLIVAIALIIYGVKNLIESLVSVILPEHREKLADIVFEKRLPRKSVRIVAIGGGTGLSTLLRGIKRLPVEPTALVTVADDGGSSGRLRQELGILPPGDIRNCLVALSDTEPLMEDLFQYRFDEGPSLGGHNFGNIFIAALTKITGDFAQAVISASQVLRVKGRALPITLDDVTLRAEFEDGTVEEGETRIRQAGKKIKSLSLQPHDSHPLENVLELIRTADAIILGPGSLFTSVIPPLLQKEVTMAIKQSWATKIYVANIMTEHGETDGFTVSDHLSVLFSHAGGKICDYCLINKTPISAETLKRYSLEFAEPVKIDVEKVRALGVIPVVSDLAIEEQVVRHDPLKLAQSLWGLILKAKHKRSNVSL